MLFLTGSMINHFYRVIIEKLKGALYKIYIEQLKRGQNESRVYQGTRYSTHIQCSIYRLDASPDPPDCYRAK